MALIRKSHFPNIPSLLEEFFDKDSPQISTPSTSTSKSTSTPPVNILETDQAYHIELAAPGMEHADFTCSLSQTILSISCEKAPAQAEESSGIYRRQEFQTLPFQRTFSLPDTADASQVETEYEAGLLKISIAKKSAND